MSPRSKKKLCRGIELCLFTAWIKEKKKLVHCAAEICCGYLGHIVFMLQWLSRGICMLAWANTMLSVAKSRFHTRELLFHIPC